MPARESEWATRQAWLAHFAVSDVEGERFRSSERWSRGAAGLAGARMEPFRVWLKDWSAQAAGGPVFPMRLQASAEDVGLDLTLQQGKPPVLQGERGLSRKSAEPGNASYYYSLTRMPAEGTVRLGGERFAVTGLAWMDREWSTSSLGADQVGWDWFALQLSDGSDLMLYQLRRKGGAIDPASSGTLVGPDGGSAPLSSTDFSIVASLPLDEPAERRRAIRPAGGCASPPRGWTWRSAPFSPTRSWTCPSATGKARWRSRAPAAAVRCRGGVTSS